MAAEKGKSTGIVVTKSVTDATPATFTAHVAERSLQKEIAENTENSRKKCQLCARLHPITMRAAINKSG